MRIAIEHHTQTMTTAFIPQPPPFLTTTAATRSSPKPTTVFASNSSKSSCLIKNFKISSSLNNNNSNGEPAPQSPPQQKKDPVKAAFERAQAYKKSLKPNPSSTINEPNQFQKIEQVNSDPVIQNPVQEFSELSNEDNGGSGSGSGNIGGVIGKKEVPASVRIALERARKYKKDGGLVSSSTKEALPGPKEGNEGSLQTVDVEKKVGKKKDNPKISSMNFVGLGFADKKIGRGLPAGLVPFEDSFSEDELGQVEFIAGDSTRFGDATSADSTVRDNDDIYKPKVSTWGVFPRPNNISKAYGGGRTLRPGEVLETEEDKAARVKQTRQLLAAYKKKIGLNIDPKLRAECEKTLKNGDSLMDSGNLKEALPYYEEVMSKLPFKNEVHGLAALQWSICQDSLNRTNEARIMYEKLQTHPNVPVGKKARQLMFSFQAMEMMKVTSSFTATKNINYGEYFEAFVEDKEKYIAQDGEAEVQGALSQFFPYILFLLSPILMVVIIAVQKRQ